MVIQHRNGLCLIQKFRALGHTRLVGIDYNYHGIFRQIILHFLTGDKNIFRIRRILRNLIIQRPHGTGDFIDNDMRSFAKLCGCDLMSHHQNTVLNQNKFPQTFCFDSGLDSGIFRHLFLLAAEIGDSVAIFDDRLVTASCKCQVDGRSCISHGIQTKSNTERSASGVSDIDILNIFQNGKFIFRHLQITLFLDDNKVFIFFQLLYDTVHISDILIDLTVDQRNQKGLPDLFHTFHDLVIVVDIDQSCDQTLFFILLHIGFQLGDIPHIQCDKIFLVCRNMQQTLTVTESFHGHLAQFHCILPVVIGDLHLHLILCGLRINSTVQLRNHFI